MYVYMDAGACGSQQMLDPLELELWTMMWVMEAELMSSGQAARTLNPWAISSPSSNFLILYVFSCTSSVFCNEIINMNFS